MCWLRRGKRGGEHWCWAWSWAWSGKRGCAQISDIDLNGFRNVSEPAWSAKTGDLGRWKSRERSKREGERDLRDIESERERKRDPSYTIILSI